VNLINFDSYRWFGLPSYYVQQMFSCNQGTVTLPVNIDNAPAIDVPHEKGCIGLGTWNNAAEFKDVQVLSPDGKTLFKADFSKLNDKWRKTGRGDWSVQQAANASGVTAFMGDTAWMDYTITLKARKLYGENGFQIYFHNRNNSERTRWDIGGYNNTVYYLEMGLFTESLPCNIEPGVWHDIKMEVRSNSFKGYLDGKLIQEVSDANMKVRSITASASKDEKSGDIILKVVNSSKGAGKTQIELKGAGKLSSTYTAIVLTSTSPLDENTLELPVKVSPKTETIKISGASINRSFPGNSLTVIRFATSDKK